MLKLRNEESEATLHCIDAKMKEQTVHCLEKYFQPDQCKSLLKNAGHALHYKDTTRSLVTEHIGRLVHVSTGFREYWVCNLCGRRVERKETARRHMCREAIER